MQEFSIGYICHYIYSPSEKKELILLRDVRNFARLLKKLAYTNESWIVPKGENSL